ELCAEAPTGTSTPNANAPNIGRTTRLFMTLFPVCATERRSTDRWHDRVGEPTNEARSLPLISWQSPRRVGSGERYRRSRVLMLNSTYRFVHAARSLFVAFGACRPYRQRPKDVPKRVDWFRATRSAIAAPARKNSARDDVRVDRSCSFPESTEGTLCGGDASTARRRNAIGSRHLRLPGRSR